MTDRQDYRDAGLAIDDRLKALMSEMTAREKVAQLGAGFHPCAGIAGGLCGAFCRGHSGSQCPVGDERLSRAGRRTRWQFGLAVA